VGRFIKFANVFCRSSVINFVFFYAVLSTLTTVIHSYLVSLSGALAVLNVVPCYALDGQWILLSLTHWLAAKYRTLRRVGGAIYRTVLVLGTLLVVANVTVGLWVLLAS